MSAPRGTFPEQQTADLRRKISDLEAALDAIRSGGVDAVIMGAPEQERLYTLASADRPYRVIVEEMGEGAATVSGAGTVLYANRQLADLLGRDRGTLLGTRAESLVVPSEVEQLRHLLTVEPGRTVRRELTMVSADGHGIPALVSVTGLDIDGVLLHCLVAADLSERRSTEAQLAAAHADLERRALELARTNRRLARTSAQFSAAFEHAPVGMALVSFDRTVLRANGALSTLLGLPSTRLLGRTIDELILGEASDRELFAELAADQLNQYTCELRLMTASGEPRWVTFSVARVTEPGGADYAAFHVEDITDRKGYENQLQYFAEHDPLTGLLNRRRFRDELEDFLELTDLRPRRGVLALLDLDGFKYVNDTLGHPVGDALLQAVSAGLQRRLRSSDRLARLGGDEFAVLMYEIQMPEAVALVEDLLRVTREQTAGTTDQRARTSASAGLVALDGTGGQTADEVIANADLAMYSAKEHGRNRLAVYDPFSPAVARSTATFVWADRIRAALEEDLFVLQAQPILDLTTGQTSGCELLLRMRDGHALVPPLEFLEIAERHGFAGAIDDRVLHLGIALAGRSGRPPGFRFEINLTGAALADPTVPGRIERLLAEHDVNPASIVFEITETLAITNRVQAEGFAAEIHRLGCGFAIDDFGAGYGGFYYLKFLPLDYLKIDGEFIRDLATDRTNQVIVQAMVAAARPLGKQTIAEYVGDEHTIDLLREYGVDHAQGYYIGVPTDPEKMLAGIPAPGSG